MKASTILLASIALLLIAIAIALFKRQYQDVNKRISDPLGQTYSPSPSRTNESRVKCATMEFPNGVVKTVCVDEPTRKFVDPSTGRQGMINPDTGEFIPDAGRP